jgi:murein DD-endopeptidase MepM/ murein hydrolase activator NlpD
MKPRQLTIRAFSACIVLLLAKAPLQALDTYPRIPSLSSINPVFTQYSDDVQDARMAIAASAQGTELPLHLYTYTVTADDTLITIAARCSIPYDSIASLNRIESMTESLTGRTIILPTLPGLYLPDKAQTTFENLLLSSFDPDDPSIISFSVREDSGKAGITKRAVHCIPDSTFEGTVRAFFLTPTFRFPLPEATLTSSFGMRKNPVTGNLIFHKGIDLAAPRGTPVHACADGTVIQTGSDSIYGNFIIIKHAGTKESLYGHLQTIKIELHQQVKSGTIIGTVGSTGQSTGPHLHFEIHENGVPKNPASFIQQAGKKPQG